MKRRTKKALIATLSCGLLATSVLGASTVFTAFADAARVKPTGTNTNTLTQPINDADLDTFQVYGASTRMQEPNGFRFLATIGQSDLALIPNNAEFGMLLIPQRMLTGELTENTKNAMIAPAKVDTAAKEVPSGGLGYVITLMGDTLESAFPTNLYGTVISARAYVKYTYTVNGETITDYAYSSQTLNRSIAYVASCELADMAEAGVPDTNENSFLNQIIAQTAPDVTFTLSEEVVSAGGVVTVSLQNATDGLNVFDYTLSSSNESVAIINEQGEIETVGGGTTEITLSIGAKEITKTLTVEGAQEFTDGDILYSTRDGVIFMPNGLLDDGEKIVSAIGTEDGVNYFVKGSWDALAQTESEINANAITSRKLTVKTSEGDMYNVDALSYAGIIDELADFPAFFNNDPTVNTPDVYGQYIVIKNLGTGEETLTYTQSLLSSGKATNGFNGVLDGLGHSLNFKLAKGGLVGYYLGTGTIKNLGITFADLTYDENDPNNGGFGIFGKKANGAAVIENCFVKRTQKTSEKKVTVFGLISVPNNKLIVRNVVVDDQWLTIHASNLHGESAISADSYNVFIINGRPDKGAATWASSANITEIVSGNTLTSDLSGLPSAYWTTGNNRPGWRMLGDTAVTRYEASGMKVLDEKALYSTVNNELLLPTEIGGMENVTSITSESGEIVYYEEGVWYQDFALTSAQIRNNEVVETALAISTEDTTYYLSIESYAGVIDELADFPAFFDNNPEETTPDVYGYYIVTKNLGTGAETLTYTQSKATTGAATNGFNGVLDGLGHNLNFTLTSGALVGYYLGTGTIKNLSIVYTDATSSNTGDSTALWGIFGHTSNGEATIENCYIYRTNAVYNRANVFGVIANPNDKLILTNVVINSNWGTNNPADRISTSTINAKSTNAFIINAHNNALTGNWNMISNFTELSGGTALTSDLSGLSPAYWSTKNNRPTWLGTAQDMAFTVDQVQAKQVEITDKVFLYSTQNGEMILADGLLAEGETIVDAWVNDVDCFDNGVWSTAVALTDEEITANAIKTVTLEIKTSAGKFYQVGVKSYAGIINELSDFATFFDNDPTATAPNVYGYYIVTADLGTGTEELALTQSMNTSWDATNGFNGVLDGQGHTLRFKLVSGGLVGRVLGTATIKNLGVIYNDASYDANDKFNTGHGVFGYVSVGKSVIDNCYVERTNELSSRSSVYGIVARPNNKLIVRNSLVYGYYVKDDCTWWTTIDNSTGAVTKANNISSASENVYVINARNKATHMSVNFTDIFASNVWEGSRSIELSAIEDVNGFDDNFWKKENGSLIWAGYETVVVSWVNGDTTTTQAVTKNHNINVVDHANGYWAFTQGGEQVTGLQKITKDTTLYACYSSKVVEEKALYSTLDRELFLPTEIGGMENVVTITNESGSIVYYENGVWYQDFSLTAEQIQNNETEETAIAVSNGRNLYYVTVESYAGVIDELADFPAFFDNDPTVNTPDVYGYYIVIKNLGTGEETLTYKQSLLSSGAETNGFNGVLDGLGHSLNFKLAKGGLVGYYLGTGTIKNLGITFTDLTYDDADKYNGGFGIFGKKANGAAVIENCFVKITDRNNANKCTVFGLIAVPNNKLIMRNVVVDDNWKTIQPSNWHGESAISADSYNVFIINGRPDKGAVTWPSSANITEIVSGNTLTSDLSGLPSAYWTTGNNRPGWRTLSETPVVAAGKINATATHLVKEGETKYAIVLPSAADANLTAAAADLQLFFAEATGAELEIVADASSYDSYSMYISIDDTRVFQNSGISLDGVETQGYRIQRINNMIYIHGGSTLGSLYGVYGLLEELFGYKQYSIDAYKLESNPTVAISDVKTVTKNPSIAGRLVSNGALALDSDYANRMKMGGAGTKINNTGSQLYVIPAGDYRLGKQEDGSNDYGGEWETYHNSLEILPYKYWLNVEGKTSWFARNASNNVMYVDEDGNLNYTGSGKVAQLCYTAGGDADEYAAMVAQIVDVMILSLATERYNAKTYPEAVYITLTSEDNIYACQCSACLEAEELYGSASGAVIKMCNDVREGLETWMNKSENAKWKRELNLLFFAYNAYVDAPTIVMNSAGKYVVDNGTAEGMEMRSDVGVFYAVSDHVNYYYPIDDNTNEDFIEQFDAWANLTSANDSALCLWLYTKNFARYMLRADVYGEDAFFNETTYQYFANAGVDLLWNQGASNGTTTLSAFEKLNGFLDAQLGWDATQSVSELTDEWFDAMYGDAAGAMRSLFEAQNDACWEIFDTDKEGLPTCWPTKNEMKSYLSKVVLEEWFGYIDEATDTINSSDLSAEEKAMYIERINEEWIAVEFWYIWLGHESISNYGSAKAAFRKVLGYDSATGTYAKEVILLEHAGCTLTEWVESYFTKSV